MTKTNPNLTPRPRINSGITFDPSENMTEQSHKEELNINNILAKFQRTGVIEHIKEHGPQYADVPAIDYREAMEIVTNSNSMFAELPSRARAHFDNDPAKFLETMQNPETKAETLHQLGLLDPSYTPPEATQEPLEAKEGSNATSSSGGDSDALASEQG